jgi:hypothetical protein
MNPASEEWALSSIDSPPTGSFWFRLPDRIFRFSTASDGLTEPAQYSCKDCIRPHILLRCDGTSGRHYEQCFFHQTHDDRRSAKLVDTLSPDAMTIRQRVGEEAIAVLWAREPEDALYEYITPEVLSSFNPKLRESCVEKMLKPREIHVDGCLHGSTPEMIISHGGRGKCGKDAGEGGKTEWPINKLATDLYFSRCDGKFKNVLGEELKA